MRLAAVPLLAALAACGGDGEGADDEMESLCDARTPSSGFRGDNSWDENRDILTARGDFLTAVAEQPSAPDDVVAAATEMSDTFRQITEAATHEQMQADMSAAMVDSEFLRLGRDVDAWLQELCGDGGVTTNSPTLGREVTDDWLSLP